MAIQAVLWLEWERVQRISTSTDHNNVRHPTRLEIIPIPRDSIDEVIGRCAGSPNPDKRFLVESSSGTLRY